jgi:uncharacterized membrane protein YadS
MSPVTSRSCLVDELGESKTQAHTKEIPMFIASFIMIGLVMSLYLADIATVNEL